VPGEISKGDKCPECADAVSVHDGKCGACEHFLREFKIALYAKFSNCNGQKEAYPLL